MSSERSSPPSSSPPRTVATAEEDRLASLVSEAMVEMIRKEDAKIGGTRIIEQLLLDTTSQQLKLQQTFEEQQIPLDSASVVASSTTSSSSYSSSSSSTSSSPSSMTTSFSSSSLSEMANENVVVSGNSSAENPSSYDPSLKPKRFFLTIEQILATNDGEALMFWARTLVRRAKELIRDARDGAMDHISERLMCLADEKFSASMDLLPYSMRKDVLYEKGKNLMRWGKLLELGKMKLLIKAHETYLKASNSFEATLELDGSQPRVFKHWAKAIDRLAFLRPSDKSIGVAVDMFLIFYSNLVMKVYAHQEELDLDELDLKPLIAIALSENKHINSKGIDVVRHLVKIMDDNKDKEFQREARRNLKFLEEILAQRLNKKVVKFEDLPEDCKKLIKTSGLTWDAVKDHYDAFLHCLWFERSKFKTPRKQTQTQQTQGQKTQQQQQRPAQKPVQKTQTSSPVVTTTTTTASPSTPAATVSPKPVTSPAATNGTEPSTPVNTGIIVSTPKRPLNMKPSNSAPDTLFIYQNPTSKFKDYEKIGMGAYGNVYRAKTNNSGKNKRVAIKVMNVQNSRALKHIRYEISVLASLKHPNIVNYIESYYFNSCVWCVMEFCDAGTLQQLIKGYQLDEWEICYVSKQLLKAIHFLHEQNYIHRDIKPENILLTGDSQIKLADLGLCTQLTTAIESKMAVSGSSYWIAPEMILHEPYGCKVDIWSFGCVLMELAERRPPYGEFRALKAIFYTATKGPPKLQQKSKWTTEFVDCLESCMQYDPDNRPSSAQLIKHPFVNRTVSQKLMTVRPALMFDI